MHSRIVRTADAILRSRARRSAGVAFKRETVDLAAEHISIPVSRSRLVTGGHLASQVRWDLAQVRRDDGESNLNRFVQGSEEY
jgi:hypothetical protein